MGKALSKERNRRKSEQSSKRFRPLKHRTRLKKSAGSCAKNRTSEKAEKPCFRLRKIRENSLSVSLAKSRKTIAAKGRKTGATKRYFGSFYLHTKSHAIFGLPRFRTVGRWIFRNLCCSLFLLFRPIRTIFCTVIVLFRQSSA